MIISKTLYSSALLRALHQTIIPDVLQVPQENSDYIQFRSINSNSVIQTGYIMVDI